MLLLPFPSVLVLMYAVPPGNRILATWVAVMMQGGRFMDSQMALPPTMTFTPLAKAPAWASIQQLYLFTHTCDGLTVLSGWTGMALATAPSSAWPVLYEKMLLPLCLIYFIVLIGCLAAYIRFFKMFIYLS